MRTFVVVDSSQGIGGGEVRLDLPPMPGLASGTVI